MKRTNRLLSLLLVFLMVLTLVPTTVFAEGKAEITPIFELPKLEAGKQVNENSITVNNDAIEITEIRWHTQEKRAVLKSEIGKAYDEFAWLNPNCKLADYSRSSLDHSDHYSKETQDYEVVWKGTTPWNRGTTDQYETFPFNFHAGSQYIAYVQFRVKDGYTLDSNNSVYVRIGSGGSLITRELPISEDGYMLCVDYDALADQDISQVDLKSKLNAGQTWLQLQQQLNFSADAQGCNIVTSQPTSATNKNPDPHNKYQRVYATGFCPAIFDKTDSSKNHEAKSNSDYTYFPGGLYGSDSLIEGHRYEVVLYLRPLLGYDFKNFGSEKSAKSFWKSGKLTLTDSSTDQTINGSYIKRKGTAFWKNEQKSYRAGQPGFETTYYCVGMFPTYLYDTMEVKFTFTAGTEITTPIETTKIYSRSSDAGNTKVNNLIPELDISEGQARVSEQHWYKDSMRGTALSIGTDKFEAGHTYYCMAKLTPNEHYSFTDSTEISLETDDGDNLTGWTVVSKSAGTNGDFMIILLQKTFPSEPKEYAISYDLDGGSWDGTAGVDKYVEGSEVTLPTNVTKSGYDFVDWYEVENGFWYGPYDKLTVYDSGNKTFTAKWKLSADTVFPIKVRIDNTAGRTDKGATVALDKTAAAGGDTVTVQVNVKDGYTLDSVSIAKIGGRGQITLNDLGNGKYNFTMPSDFSNTNTNYAEITVKTTKNTYNINWNLNGGEKAGSSWGDEVYYRSTYTVTDYGFNMPTMADVKKEGYKLVGWYTNSACTGDPVLRHEQGETGDKNYYAKWEKASYAVEAGRQVSGYISVDKATAQMGDMVTVTAIPNPGYKLSGGTLRYTYTDPNTNATKSEVITGNTFTMPGADVKITASFDTDPYYEFDITVTGGTASLGAGSTITKAKEGTVVKLNATVPEDMTFKEWEVVIGNTTITNATSATDASFTMPFGDVEINAVFEDATPVSTPITNVAATVTAPAIGAHPDFSATAVTTPGGAVERAFVSAWVKMAKADYLAGSDDWIHLTSTDVFEAGYYYAVFVSVYVKDGYLVTASTTGTINNSNNLFDHGYTDSAFHSGYLFEPMTVSEYDIIVTNGKATVGAGSEISKAATGTVVTITADPAEAGKQFDKWEVIYGGVTIADVNSATTTFTMGGENVKVRATYKDAAPSHTHTYGTEWKSDDTNHWKECTDTACPNPAGSVKDKAAHTLSDWIIDTAATATADGAKHKECTVCHKVLETATIPATGSGHTHAYGETWKSDADNHWHECDCGDKADIAAHSFAWKIDREATKTETGLKHEECSVCGAKRNENTVIDKLPDGGNTNPGGNTKPGGNDEKNPQTGDTSNLIGWMAALFVSGSILTVLGVTAKKRKENEAE